MPSISISPEHQTLYLWFIMFPFLTLSIMWSVLLLSNRKTAWEVKNVLPPEVLLKVMTLFMLVCAIFILGMERVVNESTISALLGAIATGILGIALKGKERSGPD